MLFNSYFNIMRKMIAIIGVIVLLGFMSYTFLFKNDSERYLDQGIEYFSENRYEEAIRHFEIAENLGSIDALKYSGSIYLETNNPQKAIPKFEKYISNIKNDKEELKFALNDLGVAYFKINNIPNAKKYWKKAADLGNQTSINNLKEIEKK